VAEPGHCGPGTTERELAGVTTTVGLPTAPVARGPGWRSGPRARSSDRAFVVLAVVVANAAVTLGLWFRHGGLDLMSGPGGVATAAGQLTALAGTYAVLFELLLMSRIPWLERYIGLDRLAVWHRWNGFAAVALLLAHTVLTTVGYAQGARISFVAQTGDFVSHYADVLMAFVGLGLLIAVAATSVRFARRTLRRETWYAIHLYAYLAVALSFAHQLAVGTDFSTDRVARVWWITLYVVVFGSIAMWRVGWPVLFNTRHHLRVHSVARETPGVVSIYFTGRALDRVGAQAGQFFLWRFVTPDGWWKAHPFSLSAAPTARRLRITVKDLGDTTHVLQKVRKGTRVIAEGPYGTFTADRRTRRQVLLIAGGIGITPLRALVASLRAAPGDITLLYRAESADDVIFRDEITDIGARRGIVLHALLGAEIGDDRTDQLGFPAIMRLVPDVRERDVFVCGPPGMIDALRRRLRRIGVPGEQVHFERFEF
jgi:predicted ferric reductase